MSNEVVAGTPAIEDFVASLASAWTDGEARPTHRKQPKAKHWWRTRVDPFADAYASKAQLRTLQRRVKAWRAERAKEMVLGRLCVPDVMSVEV